MRKQNSKLIEAISRMEKAGYWQVVCYLLELVQRRAQMRMGLQAPATDAVQKEKVTA
jgi:hypothetical protein